MARNTGRSGGTHKGTVSALNGWIEPCQSKNQGSPPGQNTVDFCAEQRNFQTHFVVNGMWQSSFSGAPYTDMKVCCRLYKENT